MILNETYTKAHMESILKNKKCDPQFLEKSIFAFGLLEALSVSGASFIFKGGTSLMLLLDKPMRLSTDIDILVDKNYDIEKYIELASTRFPFKRFEKDERKGKNGIVKKHFKFFYDSPFFKDRELYILLDVLFENNNYSDVIEKEIVTDFLNVDSNKIMVKTPNIDSILGDKLTAFAPNTIGIQFDLVTKFDEKISKRIEVIKQFFDVACLFDKVTDFNKIKDSYIKIANAELAYRNLNITYKECLIDSFQSALCLFSKGRLANKDYEDLLEGVKRISGYIYGTKVNNENIYQYAAKVMLLSAGLLADFDVINLKKYEYPLKIYTV